MPSLSPELKRLEEIEGTVVPDTTVVLSRRVLPDEDPRNIDAVAQITKISVPGTPKGDHYFRLGLPDMAVRRRGVIEVDATQPDADPNMAILAEGLFGDDPGVLGGLTRAALTEAGVDRAVVEPEATNLPAEFLLKAGGHAVKAAGAERIMFYPVPPREIHENRLAA